MGANIRKGPHTVSRLTYHLVWSTKYRYKVLSGDLKVRCREILMQVCDAHEIDILKGVVFRPCSYAYRICSKAECERYCQAFERPFITEVAAGVSCIEEEILGESFLGKWLRSLEYWQYYG